MKDIISNKLILRNRGLFFYQVIFLFFIGTINSVESNLKHNESSNWQTSISYSFTYPTDIQKKIENGTNDNYTQKMPKDDYIVEYYAYPVIFIIGSCCNILTFIVMRRKKMRHQSTYFYMAVLAIADEMVLINGCLNFWIYLSTGKNVAIMSAITCKIACIGLYGTLHFSVWMVVIMTIERFIAVALPLQANRLCTVKRAKIATCSLALIIFIINIHFLFTHSLLVIQDEPSCFTTSEIYEFFMEKIWPWIDASIYSFIPLTLLIIFNILIVHNLIKASKNIEKINNNNVKNNQKRKLINKNKKIERQSSEAELHDYHERNKENRFYNIFFYRLIFMSNIRRNSINKKIDQEKKIKFKFVKANNSNNLNTQKEQDMLIVNASSCQTNNTRSESVFKNTSGLYQNGCGVHGGTHGNTSSSANRRLTITLLVVSMTFFITSMPIVTLQTIEKAYSIEQSKTLYIIRGIFLVLQYMNHSINFFLYAVTGKTFRREFLSLLEPCKKRFGFTNNRKDKRNLIINKKNNFFINNNHHNLKNKMKNNNLLDNKTNQTNHSNINSDNANKLIDNNILSNRYSASLDENGLISTNITNLNTLNDSMSIKSQLANESIENLGISIKNDLLKTESIQTNNDNLKTSKTNDDVKSSDSYNVKNPVNKNNKINLNDSVSDLYFVQSEDEIFRNRKESIF